MQRLPRLANIGRITLVCSFSPPVEDYPKAIYLLESEAADPVTASSRVFHACKLRSGSKGAAD